MNILSAFLILRLHQLRARRASGDKRRRGGHVAATVREDKALQRDKSAECRWGREIGLFERHTQTECDGKHGERAKCERLTLEAMRLIKIKIEDGKKQIIYNFVSRRALNVVVYSSICGSIFGSVGRWAVPNREANGTRLIALHRH